MLDPGMNPFAPNTQMMGMQPQNLAHLYQTQGRSEPSDPDVTPMDEAARTVMRFVRDSQNSAMRTKAMNWWMEADKMIEGRHWESESRTLPPWAQNPAVINKMWAVRDKLVSLLMESVPLVEIIPRTPDDDDIAKTLDGFINHEWDRNKWTATVAMAYKKSIAHGISFIKTYWDAEGDGGRGTIRLEPVSNYELLLHDAAMVREGKLVTKYAIHCFEKTRQELIAKYGVDPEGEMRDSPENRYDRRNMAELQRRNEMNIGESHYPSEGGMGANESNQKSPQAFPKKDGIKVYECWYWDDTRVEGEEYDSMAEQGPLPLQYPHGRIIVVANNQVMLDEPSELAFNPFVPITNNPDMDCIYTPSVMNQIAGPQMVINKLFFQIQQHAALCANPVKVVTHAAQVNKDSVTNQPGYTFVSRDIRGGGLDWLNPPPLGREVYDALLKSEEAIDDISGMHDVNKGEEPTQARSGVAIERLQSEGRTRSNMMAMFLDQGLHTMIENCCSMALDFVSDDRLYRVLDATDLVDAFGNFNPTEMLLPRRKQLIAGMRGQQDEVRQNVGGMVEVKGEAILEEVMPQAEAAIEELERQITIVQTMPAHDLVSFDIDIQTGTRNMSQTARSSMAMEFFQLDVITRFELLRRVKWPNALKVYQEKIQEQQMQADMQAQAEQMAFEREKELKQMEFDHQIELEKIKLKGRQQSSSSSAKKPAKKKAA